MKRVENKIYEIHMLFHEATEQNENMLFLGEFLSDLHAKSTIV